MAVCATVSRKLKILCTVVLLASPASAVVEAVLVTSVACYLPQLESKASSALAIKGMGNPFSTIFDGIDSGLDDFLLPAISDASNS